MPVFTLCIVEIEPDSIFFLRIKGKQHHQFVSTTTGIFSLLTYKRIEAFEYGSMEESMKGG